MEKDILNDVHPDHYFWLADGRILKNLKELHQTLQTMDESIFRHHVNDEKNDFHNWVRDVHQDEALARDLFTARGKEETISALGRRIKKIENALQKSEQSDAQEKVQKKALEKKLRGEWRRVKSNSVLKKAPASPESFIAGGVRFVAKKFSPNTRTGFALTAIIIAVTILAATAWLGGKAATVTGAAVGAPLGTPAIMDTYSIQEIQFISLGSMAAIIILLFVALKAHKKRTERREKTKRRA